MLGRYVLLCYCRTAFTEEEKLDIENRESDEGLTNDRLEYWKNYNTDNKISKDRMIYKKVYKDEKIQYIEIGRINEIKDNSLNFPGEKTPEGGEIFNDYENNIAGSMCYTITAIDSENKTYTLDSTEGLAINDIYSVHLYYSDNSSSQGENIGKITNINNNVVTVDVFYIQEGKIFVTKESYIDENGLDKEHNTFRIIEKPLVGNRYIGYYSHAENSNTQALSKGAHAEGNGTKAYGSWSHAEGRETQAGYAAHAEGCGTKAKGFGSHAEGQETIAKGAYSHTEGSYTDANGENSHAGGYNSMATGKNSFTHGDNVKAYFENQVVFGKFNTQPESTSRFIIGNGIDKENPSNLFEIKDDKVIHNNEKLLKTDDVNTMLKDYTPTNNLVYGYRVSNAENVPTGSNCFNSHSGHNITGNKSNAFGERHTIAATTSNAFGSNNTINNNASNSIVNGDGNTANRGNSLISGQGLTGYLNNQTVLGQYNNPTRNTAFDPVLIVGGGDSIAKKDIMSLKRYKGDLWVAGDVLVGGTDTGHTDAKILATEEYVDNKISSLNPSGYMPLTGGKIASREGSYDFIDITPELFKINYILTGTNSFIQMGANKEIGIDISPKYSGYITLSNDYCSEIPDSTFTMTAIGVEGNDTAKMSWQNWLEIDNLKQRIEKLENSTT